MLKNSPLLRLCLLWPLLALVAMRHPAMGQPQTKPRTAMPAAPVSVAIHPLIGTWSWTLPGKACSETLQYRTNGSRLATSGEEVTDADYEVTPLASAAGFYQLKETLTQTNGKRDCYGDLHESSDDAVTRFIQFSPKQDQFIVCKAESLQACFGPLKRVP